VAFWQFTVYLRLLFAEQNTSTFLLTLIVFLSCMENFQIIIFLLAVLISLSALMERIKIPQPIVLVVAGLLIGFIPSLPDLALDPEIIFLIFLPPLLFDAAAQTSWHDFKADIRPISALAISLVFFTTLAVAATAHYLVPHFGWPLAFLLGAIISPTDAVAASGIIRGLNLNRRVMTILEGESLVNDASALIAYRHALTAVLTGNFIFWEASIQFLIVAGGGILIGIIVGYILVFVHKKITNNPLVETGMSLLTPFLAYISAEEAHVSGILSVVTAGLIISWRSPEIFSYQTRMRTRVIWDTIVFMLNGFVFILIGLQLPGILKQVVDYTARELIGYGMVISLVTILVRILWVFAGAYATRMFRHKKNPEDGTNNDQEPIPWKNILIIAWTGTRGVLSLAAALALPLVLDTGKSFPQRHLILFLAFVVIFVTLVVQGLSLPWLIRILNIKPDTITESKEQKELELHIVNSTMHYIDRELPIKLEADAKNLLKNKYNTRADKLVKEIRIHERNQTKNKPAPVAELTPVLSAQLEIGKFQRELLIKLHKEGTFSDVAIKEVQRSMDIDDMKLNQLLPKDDENQPPL
jgi:Na+/H+ antiporter